MGKVTTNENNFAIELSVKEFNEAGLDPNKEYRIVKVDDSTWLLMELKESKAEIKEIDEVEEQISGLLKKKPLKDRVEGKFEKFLNEKELKKFSEMLSSGKVEKFKLNESYKKAVYQLPEKKQGEEKICFENTEKEISDYSLEEDGFLVVKNEMRAKRISDELSQEIKEGKIKGTRSFDGFFYIIKSPLYDLISEKTLGFLEEKEKAELEEISKELKITKTLIRIICEFLKEEGLIIEKRKELYQAV
jgi:hypothetical protein